jgi:hypothetical protein
MALHLMDVHGISRGKLLSLFSGQAGDNWSDFLKINHDLLHSLNEDNQVGKRY